MVLKLRDHSQVRLERSEIHKRPSLRLLVVLSRSIYTGLIRAALRPEETRFSGCKATKLVG
jgi:hypothetical protein